jgi:hypothetical protein
VISPSGESSPSGDSLENAAGIDPLDELFDMGGISEGGAPYPLREAHDYTWSFCRACKPSEIKASSTAGTAIDITYDFVDPSSGHNAGHVYGITSNLNSEVSRIFRNGSKSDSNRDSSATRGSP